MEQARDPANDAQSDERREHEHEGHRPVVSRHSRAFPSWVTQVALVISSAKSSCSLPSFVMWPMKVATFFEYIWLACKGTELGRFTGPRMPTPWWSVRAPSRVSSQFPPRSEEHTSEL